MLDNAYEEIFSIAIGILLVLVVLGTISFVLSSALIGSSYRELFTVQKTITNINKATVDYLVKTGGQDNVGGSMMAEEVITKLLKENGVPPTVATTNDFKVEIIKVGLDGKEEVIGEHTDQVRGDIIRITTTYTVPMTVPKTVLGISIPNLKYTKPREIVTEGYVHRYKQLEEEEGGF